MKPKATLGVAFGMLFFASAGSALRAGPPARHEDNPINRPVGTVKPTDFRYPQFGERVNLTRLQLRRWSATGGYLVDLGNAKCIGRGLSDKWVKNTPMIPPNWRALNGATLYTVYYFEFDRPLGGGTFFNNDPSHDNEASWTWQTYQNIKGVTICYTSRGMIVSPEMPQKGMILVNSGGTKLN